MAPGTIQGEFHLTVLHSVKYSGHLSAAYVPRFEVCRGYSNILRSVSELLPGPRGLGPWNLIRVNDERVQRSATACGYGDMFLVFRLYHSTTIRWALLSLQTMGVLPGSIRSTGCIWTDQRPPPLVDYLPDRHYLPLLPCTVACIVQADTYRTALHSIVCISALNRSTLTGSSLPCYPLPGPSPPDLDRSLPVKSGCPQSPSASDPPPG